MKKILLSSILLLTILLPIISQATETTKKIDFSGATTEVIVEEEKKVNKIKISGIKDFEDEQHKILYLLSNNENETIDTSTNGSNLLISTTGTTEIPIQKSTDMYLNIWVVRDGTVVKLINSYKIERTLCDLSKRIGARILKDTDNSNYINVNIIQSGFSDITKVKYKIGKITNNDLLLKIKNNATVGINELLTYTKENSGIRSGELENGKNNSFPLNTLGLVNNAYYYGYFSIEGNSGTHYQLEDVTLFQAKVSSKSQSLHYYGDSEFTWDFEETVKKYLNFPTSFSRNSNTGRITVKNYTGRYKLFYQFVKSNKAVIDKITEINNKYSNREISYSEYLKQWNEAMTPYDSLKWIETTDGTVEINMEDYADDEYFILWGKLILIDEDSKEVYESDIYTQGKTITSDKELDKIEVTTMPNKTSYKEGERFNPTGMIVIATYKDGTTKAINLGDYTYSPTGELSIEDGKITVTYTENETTKTTQFKIEVSEDSTIVEDDNLPNTGKMTVITSIFVIIVLGTFGYVRYKKYKDCI